MVVARSDAEAQELTGSVKERYKQFVAQDTRIKLHPVLDAPKQQGDFVVSDEEFIAGTPAHVAERIVEQCRRIGAGHFLAVLHWAAGLDEVAAAHDLFGREVIPVLRKAEVR